jgi:DNA (cytosine-5)-methyltransferase 1
LPLSPATLARIAQGRQRFPEANAFIVTYYGTGTAYPMGVPLPTVTTVDRFGLVVAGVDGLRFRMLQPRELARAMGFSDDYVLEGTKRQQVARIGNAVCPSMAEALVRANM